MTIWDPTDPNTDPDTPPPVTRPAPDEYDSTALDITLLILLLAVIGGVIWYGGKLLWVVWPSLRFWR